MKFEDFTIRTILYSLSLVLGLVQAPLSFLLVAASTNSYAGGLDFVFGLLSGLIGVFAFVWHIVLIAHNNRPKSLHALCQLKTHLLSFYTIAGLWFVSSIFLTSQAAAICIKSPFSVYITVAGLNSVPFACSLSGAATTFAWFSFIATLATAFFIHTRGIVYGFDMNIATMSTKLTDAT